MKRSNRIFAGALLWVLCAGYLSPVQAELARVALIPSGGERSAIIVDLLTVKMAEEQDVILLERTLIRDVLTEHNLSMDGVLSSDSALKLGALYGCDILAEIHYLSAQDDFPSMIRAIGFDSTTGIRLWNIHVPLERGDSAAVETLRRGLAQGVKKWGQIRTEGHSIRTVSISEPRVFDLPAADKNIPQQISLLLEWELMRAPSIAVLERKRLDLVNQERDLAQIARDRLLASAVRLDLDILRGPALGDVEVRAMLRDGAGNHIATVRHIGPAAKPASMAIAIAALVFERLDAIQIVPDAQSYINEALQMYEEGYCVKLRGDNKTASLIREASFALAETALEIAPEDARLRRHLSQIFRIKAYGEADPWRRLALLERFFDLAEDLPYRAGPRGITHNVAARIRQTLQGLDALPGQKNTGDERLLALRSRYGKWVCKMQQHDKLSLVYLYNIELYARDLDEALEEADRQLTRAAPDLNFAHEVPRLGVKPLLFIQKGHSHKLIHPIGSYTPTQRRRLLKLYDKWGSNINAAMLVNSFPQDHESPETLVKEYLQAWAKHLAKYPARISRAIGVFYMDQPDATRHRSLDWIPFPKPIVVEIAQWLNEELLSQGLVEPELYLLLAKMGEHAGRKPGELLENAYRLLETGTHKLPHERTDAEPTISPALQLLAVYAAKDYDWIIDPKPPSSNMVASVVEKTALFQTRGTTKIIAVDRTPDGIHILLDAGDAYEVFTINPDDGQSASLGCTPKQFQFKDGATADGKLSSSFGLISAGESLVCLPRMGGITVFPRSGGLPWAIGMEHGLPVERVVAVREADGMLYISCRGESDGYLLKCRPDGSGMTNLASSGNREKRSVLDNTVRPYTIESLHYDHDRGLLFLVITGIPWGWLYAINLESGQISLVFKPSPYCNQLRHIGGSKYAIGVSHGWWGYGVWDASSFQDNPIDPLQHINPIMGSIHPDKRNWTVPDKPNWTVGRSLYSVPSAEFAPLSTDALAFWDEHHLIVSNGKAWQIIQRTDIGRHSMNIPLLHEKAPFWLESHDGRVLACTENALWQLRIAVNVVESGTNQAVKIKPGSAIVDRHINDDKTTAK